MQLTDEELLRYSRQILLKDVDVTGQLKLKASSVLIVGVGGLGSPAALYLAAAGVGRLILADYDKLDLTNLQRQVIYQTNQIQQTKVAAAKQRLLALNPLLEIEPMALPISDDNIESLVSSVAVVLDCSDNFLTRELINKTCVTLKKPLVSGAAIRLQGQITVFDNRHMESPCYHCLFGTGGEQELTCSEAGILGPVVGIIGAMQALEAIKLIVGFGRTLVGKLLLFDAATSCFKEVKITADPSCKVCGTAQNE